ncbi:titin homolog [Orussus abietinus]|uniref:titin homolog n=1 Tax=Orussus abietinus TaxID=222816 RepID=UPI0006269F38|nr:titin homolog [Orussus abietinus]
MATYLKRTSKLFDLSLSRMSAEVNLRDLMCPVCRGILIEPVTLPCTHNLCLRCLKGTFEHNSLSCPLCRVRVGSWLRTATKSETLVNNGLWELIRTKFPREVESKHNGDEADIELDSDYTRTNKILSAAGEIRREYEAQLRIAEEEMRRQREAERIASEALIRKIQEEEQHQLTQLAQDQLLAKSLAKRQIMDKDNEAMRYYNEYLNVSMPDCNIEKSKLNMHLTPVTDAELSTVAGINLQDEKAIVIKSRDGLEPRKSNVALISKIRTERYASNIRGNPSNIYNDIADNKLCCQKAIPMHNTVARTLKHPVISKFPQPCGSKYVPEPGCSGSKMYGLQSKEELHVPSDVLTNNKKRLGVEVCVTVGEDDERIGSAESAGSHDSINQEIHHFKPIKAMPRTPLKMSPDGKQIDPKLIRVIPLLKYVSNVVPKPPAPTHLKRMIGCSWSAFKGKARQDLKIKETSGELSTAEEDTDKKSSSSLLNQFQNISNKLVKSQVSETVRRLDLEPELAFDSNKNYAKNINRMINGTKVSKKLILGKDMEPERIGKSWKGKNGILVKCRRQKSWDEQKDVEHVDSKISGDDDNEDSDIILCSPNPAESSSKYHENTVGSSNVAVHENIAERMKKRKAHLGNETSQNARDLVEPENVPRRTTKKSNKKNSVCSEPFEDTGSALSGRQKRKAASKSAPKSKRQRPYRLTRANFTNLTGSVESLIESSDNGVASEAGKLSCKRANKKTPRSLLKGDEFNSLEKNLSETEDLYDSGDGRANESASEDNGLDTDDPSYGDPQKLSEEDVIKEQERIERLVLQEKQDFELAQRLQAKFNEMERIAGRTRGSRRALENGSLEADLFKIDLRKSAKKTNAHTAKRAINGEVTSSPGKQRRPQRRAAK